MTTPTPTVSPEVVEPKRDATATVERAHRDWTTWLPGDGTSYRVHVLPINGGPDHTDLLLLINQPRSTWAFQCAGVAYRHAEAGRWTQARARKHGIPDAIWNAAKPLLTELGVTTKRFTATRTRDLSGESEER